MKNRVKIVIQKKKKKLLDKLFSKKIAHSLFEYILSTFDTFFFY